MYGKNTLNDLNKQLVEYGNTLGQQIECFQSNSEFELINKIHQALSDRFEYLIINPAAFTHTSIALRDAILSVNIPFIEVHLTNIYKRESFRQYSYFSDIAKGIITGLGIGGYRLALEAINYDLTSNGAK